VRVRLGHFEEVTRVNALVRFSTRELHLGLEFLVSHSVCPAGEGDIFLVGSDGLQQVLSHVDHAHFLADVVEQFLGFFALLGVVQLRHFVERRSHEFQLFNVCAFEVVLVELWMNRRAQMRCRVFTDCFRRKHGVLHLNKRKGLVYGFH